MPTDDREHRDKVRDREIRKQLGVEPDDAIPAPKTIRIYDNTRGFAACRGCRQRIEWAEVVESGRRMPFDEIVEVVREVVNGRWIVTALLSKVHWATCPQRQQFQRRPGAVRRR